MALVRAIVGCVTVAALPLVVWPGLERPFSQPKLVWLVASAIVLACLPARRDTAALPTIAWVAPLAWIGVFLLAGATADLPDLDALILGVAAPMFALGLVRTGTPPSWLVGAQVVGATGCALVALSQWAGLDPFAVAGWHAPIDGASVRMRVYGTLGNPNFVGVLMATSLPLTLATIAGSAHLHRWPLAVAALAPQALALMATGSRGAVLGLSAAVAVYASLRWSRGFAVGLVAVAVFAGAAIGISPARPIDTTAAGRVHLWRIVAPHATDAPMTGLGPGAVELRFPAWQRTAARGGVRDPRFAGLTDHVHNDYLEALVERGVPGLLTLLLPIAAVGAGAVRVGRQASPVLAGTAAATAAGAACALVDFPLARPAELAWWWLAVVLALQVAAPASPRASRSAAA